MSDTSPVLSAEEAFERLLHLRLANETLHVPLLVRVSKNHGSAWVKEIGPISESSRPPDQRPFRIASVTKIYVAAALYRLQEDGRLHLNDAVDRHLSNGIAELLRSAGYNITVITIDQLMRHTSGMRDHCSSEPFLSRLLAESKHSWSRLEQVEIAAGLGEPLCDPGRDFHYSDTGYVILGEVIERTFCAPLHVAIPSLLKFERVGIARTWFDCLDPTPASAGPRERQFQGDVDSSEFDATFDLFGGGGLVSTLADMDRFLRALFGRQVFASEQTLKGILEAEITPTDIPDFGHNGLMFRGRPAGQECWGHTGFWGVVATYFPERDLVFTATLNRSDQVGAYGRDALILDFAQVIAEFRDFP